MFKSHPILYLYLKLKSILSSDPSVAFLSNSLFYHLLLKSYYMVMVSSWTVAITCQGYPYRLKHGETCPPIRGACGSPSLFLNNLQKNIDSKLLMMHYVNLLREGSQVYILHECPIRGEDNPGLVKDQTLACFMDPSLSKLT